MPITATHLPSHKWRELDEFPLSIPALVAKVTEAVGDRVAFMDQSTSWSTWKQVDHDVDLTARLLTEHGITRGDVVSMQLPNWQETVVLALAVWRLGAILNPVTPIYRGSELRSIFEMAKPALTVCPADYGDTDYLSMTQQALAEAGNSCSVVTVRSASKHNGIIARGRASATDLPPLSSLDPEDICVLMFTSGTTGRPKGVLHNHQTLLYETWSIAEQFELDRPTIFMPSPLTHITGLLYGILMPILTRGSAVLQDRWNATEAVRLIEQEDCTFSVGATPFLSGLVKEYRLQDLPSSLTGFVCGGADVPPELIRTTQDVMGTVAVRAYGLTELPTLTCGSPTDPVLLRGGDDGRLIGTSEGRIVNVDDGMGELEARGPELFLGYLDPQDNESAFTPDGWFRTGDLARISGDRIQIVGRSKDIIVRGGENISSVEVENLLRTLPGVADVAVVGVPDNDLGERACAMVVPDGMPPTLTEIRVFLDEMKLARQKAPERLLLCESLDLTASGKVQKYKLRESAAARLAAGEGEVR